MIALLTTSAIITACEGTGLTVVQDAGPEVAVQMEIVSGGDQEGTIGTTLGRPLVVRALDARGRPKSGQVMNFVSVVGGGSAYAGTSITNSAGLAQDYWTLGSLVGNQVMEARAVDPRTGERLVFATFTAKGIAPPGPVLAERSLSFSSLADTARLRLSGPSSASGAATAASQSSPQWASSNSSVATVDNTGLVRSVDNGTTLVTVTDGITADTALIAVSQAVATIVVSPASASLKTGDTVVFSAAITDRNGHPVKNASATWSNRNPAVAKVNGSGQVVAVAAGQDTVIATSSGATGRAALTVATPPPPAQPTLILGPGLSFNSLQDTARLAVTAKDASGNPLNPSQLNWVSRNGAIAMVNGGLVRSLANGSTVIVASYGSAVDSAAVSVSQKTATVTVSPATASLNVGDTLRLAATAKDAAGSMVAGATFAWSSGSTSVASVDGAGKATARAAGSADVTATSGGVSASARISVAAPSSAAVSISPASIAFTSLQDTLRLAVTAKDASGNPLSAGQLTWSSTNAGAATVTTGLVRSLSDGSTLVIASYGGVADTTTVIVAQAVASVDVSPASVAFTSLQDTVRLVAAARDAKGNLVSTGQPTWSSTNAGVATVSTGLVRSQANGSAMVIASIGGVADTTTVSVAQAVASVAVAPSSLSLTAGASGTLAATARDARGNTVAGAPVTWASGNAGVATVSSSGAVTAVAAGSTTIRASSGVASATASVTVSSSSPPPASGWPNEPAGYGTFIDQPWDAVPSNGWNHLNRQTKSHIVSDPTAPLSPNNVLEHLYPAGYPPTGVEPAVDWVNMGGRKALYLGAWFKASDPWHGHSSMINKIFFFFQPSGYQEIVFTMRGEAGGPYYLQPVAVGYPDSRTKYLEQNVNKVQMVPGKWHRIEIQLVNGSGNGIIRWWQDGVLLGEYTDFRYPSEGFGELQIAPTWGGVGGPAKQQTDYYRFDQVKISVPGSGSSGSNPAPVASVTVAPATSSLNVGATAQFTATPRDSSGTALTGRTVTWSSSATGVATVDANGLVRGVAAGTATITATSGGVNGTAQVSVTAASQTGPPGTVNDLQVVSATASSITLRWTEVSNGTGTPADYLLRYGTPTISWGSADATQVSVSGSQIGAALTYTFSGLQAGTAYQFQAVAYRGTPNLNATYGGLSNVASGQTAAASTPPPPPPPSSSVLVSEGFEDGNLASRGWFDATTVATAAQARPGSSGTRSLEWRWNTGTTAPQGSSRIDFTPTGSVYLSYWVKHSDNWIGSGRAYHPHAIQILTTADDHYIGPAITHLTVYDELLYLNGNLTAQLAIQDALMIDASRLNQSLRGVTEQRSIGGYNGRYEFDDALSTVSWDAYLYSGSQYTNYKLIRPKAVTIPDNTKAQWHHIEVYWQLNSVVGGIGQQDGVLQYWVDGEVKVDRKDVYFRTGANPDMKFRTLLLAPYIGDGSPRDQSMWIDDLVIATARP